MMKSGWWHRDLSLGDAQEAIGFFSFFFFVLLLLFCSALLSERECRTLCVHYQLSVWRGEEILQHLNIYSKLSFAGMCGN